MKNMKLLLFLLVTHSCFAFIVGNPAEPNLYHDGLFTDGPKNVNARVGYVSDYIYRVKIKDKSTDEESENSHLEISTYAAFLSLNFINAIDIYSILGSTNINSDDLGFVPRKFSWSVGMKAVILKVGNFLFGGDIKYFETIQKPDYYLFDGVPGFVTNKYTLTYKETQAALGAAYNFGTLIPYAGATYLEAELKPTPSYIGLSIPVWGDEAFGDDTKTQENRKEWGFYWGLTLLAANTVSLNVESRHFDQRDVNVSGQVRF